jgi:hypothetical protein
MDIFQIIAISVLGLGVLVSFCFAIAFVAVCCKKEKKEAKIEPIKEENEEVNEIDLDAMLAKLEEASKKEVKVEESKEEPIVEIKEEPIEEPATEIVEEPAIEIIEDVEETPVVEEEIIEEAQEDVVEVVELVDEEEVKPEEEKQQPVVEVVKEEVCGPEFDYRVRLSKIKESQAKIDRDLEKTTRSILKYERTIRRNERNQKMLDRRALELTNLNLLMYSVTDIKNVDAEKKARQEELTAHIAELKASIQDAENYLETNKEKHENNLTLRDYLTHEKTRYADEVKELEALIASGKYFDDDNGENN